MTEPYGTVELGPLLRAAVARLDAAGVDAAWNDARILVAHVLETEPADLVRFEGLTTDQAEAFEGLVDRRCARIPLQHLTGTAHFRRIALRVGPGVFVPRPETELVVEAALDEVRVLAARGLLAPSVVDLCTGSGAIAGSIAVEAPGSRVAAVELSPDAFAWAEQNLAALDVDLRLGDAAGAFPDLDGSVDVVVSNPPYIPEGAHIRDPEVLEHDPALALWGGGGDGLDVMRAVVARAAALLREGGLLVVEHADVQGEAVVALLEGSHAFVEVVDHVDLAGRDRFTTGRRAAGGSPA